MAVPTPAILFVAIATLIVSVIAGDTNKVYSPCQDTTVQRHDGFTFGIAFSGYNSFFSGNNNSIQLSPCDKRLSLSNSNAQLSLFRPKVDEISLLTIDNTSSLSPESYGNGYMVAFAGLKYAARSPPVFVGNTSYVVTSFTLVLEFQKGRLNNLYWKKDGCSSCKGNSNFVCLNGEDCGLDARNCTSSGGKENCSPAIQVAFSGTDKHYQVLNSWYEFSNYIGLDGPTLDEMSNTPYESYGDMSEYQCNVQQPCIIPRRQSYEGMSRYPYNLQQPCMTSYLDYPQPNVRSFYNYMQQTVGNEPVLEYPQANEEAELDEE